jgi:hypothetical protein
MGMKGAGVESRQWRGSQLHKPKVPGAERPHTASSKLNRNEKMETKS